MPVTSLLLLKETNTTLQDTTIITKKDVAHAMSFNSIWQFQLMQIYNLEMKADFQCKH